MIVLQRFYRAGTPGSGFLFAEGLAVAVTGTLFAWWLFPDEVSLVAVFLAAISTTDSIERLLQHNRHRIIERKEAPLAANAALTANFLALFLGTMVGFSIFGLGLSPERVQALFSHQLTDHAQQTFQTLAFGDAGSLFLNNVYVMLFFFAIAIPFRQGGVMLAVAWNASVWGATFGFLARRWSQEGGPSLLLAWGQVVASCVPHMLAESSAYVMAGLAGVFLSKGLLRHALDSAPLASIVRTVGVMLALGFVLVGAGALIEGFVAPRLVHLFAGSVP